jgi:ribosome biogenesis GTPase / thiamine phosphate phosphatase
LPALPHETATVLRVDRKRVLVDAGGTAVAVQMRGRVAVARGRTTCAVAAGDVVQIERTDAASGVIVAVEPRRSTLLRPEVSGRWRHQVLVANADRAFLVFAHADPAPAAGLVDRLLVACHAGGVPPVLVFNKSDLPASERTSAIVELYGRLGYEVVSSSAATGDGVGRIEALVRGRCAVFAGPSGTGKSSLINRVLPGVRLRTGEISRATGKGRHTTTAAQLVRIDEGGGHVIDTPGVKEFGLLGIAPAELALHFPEFPVPNRCRFLDCRHLREPGCAVLSAVGDGSVAASRYQSYEEFRAELEQSDRQEREGETAPRAGRGGREPHGGSRAVPLAPRQGHRGRARGEGR